jgi:hypothetical protein
MPVYDLSNELLVEIFRSIQDTKCLANLSLCCRRIHCVVEPVLHSKFTQTGQKAIPAFLRRIIARPDLMQYVRHFSCTQVNRLPDLHLLTCK